MRCKQASLARARRAFTLVEIMIVIVIIGMLAGMVTISVRHSMGKAKVNIAKHEISTIVSAVNDYWSEKGRYPSSDEGLSVLYNKSEKTHEAFLSKKPVDPWGQAYVYNNPGRKHEFEVISPAGPDHAEISSDELLGEDAAK